MKKPTVEPKLPILPNMELIATQTAYLIAWQNIQLFMKQKKMPLKNYNAECKIDISIVKIVASTKQRGSMSISS